MTSNRRDTRKLGAQLLVLLVAVVGALWALPSSANPENNDLFAVVVDEIGLPPSANDLGVVRSRQVEPNLSLLGGMGESGMNDTPADVVQLNLFSNRDYAASYESSEILEDGAYVWNGTIPALDSGSVTIVVRDGQMTASITADAESFEVVPGEGSVHQLRQTDISLIGMVEADGIPSDPTDPGYEMLVEAPVDPRAAPGTPVIDIMVAYTPAARQGIGSRSAMENLIDANIAYTNTAFENSGIDARIRKVHTVEVNYNAGESSRDLNRLGGTNDGYMDELHSLRDQYGADLLHLIVERSNNNYCGIANLYGPFGITVRQCATGGRTFAHELGHNFGARHDWYVGAGDTAAHGHVDLQNEFLTIMSYHSRCSAARVRCTATNTFSNPDVDFNGAPTGVRSGTNRGCQPLNVNNPDCDADNAAEINANARAVADRKPTVVGGPSTPPTTVAPTTSTTVAPTTAPPSTSTTVAPTTVAPTTVAPTTAAPTTSTTVAPTTVAPTTVAPTTVAPTTVAPTTAAPTTAAPTTAAPTTTSTTVAPATTAKPRETVRVTTTVAPTTTTTTESVPPSADRKPVVQFASISDGETVPTRIPYGGINLTAHDPDVGTNDGDGIRWVVLVLSDAQTGRFLGAGRELYSTYDFGVYLRSGRSYVLTAYVLATNEAGGGWSQTSITVTAE